HHPSRQPERLLVVHDEHPNRHRRCPPTLSVPPGPRSDSDANTTVRMPELAYWHALRGATDPEERLLEHQARVQVEVLRERGPGLLDGGHRARARGHVARRGRE